MEQITLWRKVKVWRNIISWIKAPSLIKESIISSKSWNIASIIKRSLVVGTNNKWNIKWIKIENWWRLTKDLIIIDTLRTWIIISECFIERVNVSRLHPQWEISIITSENKSIKDKIAIIEAENPRRNKQIAWKVSFLSHQIHNISSCWCKHCRNRMGGQKEQKNISSTWNSYHTSHFCLFLLILITYMIHSINMNYKI